MRINRYAIEKGTADMNEAQKYKILLVDDERHVRESMAMVLESDGYEVRTAKHGIDALLQAELSRPDLVITDLNMPEMSGFELLPILRKKYPSLPLIAISGLYDCADRAPEGVTADAFYAKGHHRPGRLLSTVAALLGVTSSSQAVPLPAPLLEIAEA